jgi:UDPglucose 6-dehydrogenase
VNVLVVGLGKLGLPLAAVFADSGHKVLGFDTSEILIDRLQSQSYISGEPELTNLLSKNFSKLTFVCNLSKEILENIEIIFVIVPTPSKPDGKFSNDFLLEALDYLIPKLQKKNLKTVICIVSTVMPKSCDGEIKNRIEFNLKSKSDDTIGICYHPEFIALGSVIKNLKFPDFHLIGSSQKWAADILEKFLATTTSVEVPCIRLELLEAEIVKLAINNFITMKISFANSIMQLAENLGTVDINRTMQAIGLDSRIGSKYIKASIPYGGPCFPRDTRAMSQLFEGVGILNHFSKISELINTSHKTFLVKKILNKIESNQIIGIIGISYKQGTSVIDDSPGVMIMNSLIVNGTKVFCWDDEGALYPYNNDLNLSFDEILGAADVFVFTRSCRDIESIKTKILGINKKYIDLWENLSHC